jgi:hypothetical protein
MFDENGKKDENWFKTFSSISDLFRNNNIEHVFIKLFIKPFTPMSDVDVLISNPFEELRALKLLQEKNFRFFRPRLLGHPLKIMCEKENDPIVDIYPDVVWIRKKVGNGRDVVARKILSNIEGVEAYIPSPEDAFYMIATHAHNHLRIRSAEVLNCVSIISETQKFSWDYIFNISANYGTLDAIYLFLKTLNFESDILDKDVLEIFSKARICNVIDSWIDRQGIKFPLEIPTWLGCVYSSFYHTPKLFGKAKISEIVYDFFTSYLALSSKKLTGST